MALDEIRITDKISYIPASENPLSADIGIIREGDDVWLYDVGDGEKNVPLPGGSCRIVLSHFHRDHTGNIDAVPAQALFVSKLTFDHVHRGTIVSKDLTIGDLHIFPLPSSHTGGCLGLEVDGAYAFVGDALYCKVRNGRYVYNTQLLQEEIAALKGLKAQYLLVSHHPGMLRRKDVVLAELEEIYALRDKNVSEIQVSMEPEQNSVQSVQSENSVL